jgi:hypothetical protein
MTFFWCTDLPLGPGAGVHYVADGPARPDAVHLSNGQSARPKLDCGEGKQALHGHPIGVVKEHMEEAISQVLP